MRFGALTALLAAALSACGPSHDPVFGRAFAEAERAESAGRFAEAADKYEAASHTTKSPRESDHARYLAALMLERSGDRSRAAERLEQIADQNPPTEDSAEATYKLADMRIAEGDEERGYRDMDAMMRRFPSSGVARSALHRLLRRSDETGGAQRSLEYLRSLEAPLGKSERGEEIEFETAARLAQLGRTREARDAFLDTATRWPYPSGALWDDALYRASELDEQLGRYDDAVADLKRMLKERESSTVVGSYERPHYGPGQLRLAILYRDRLHDHARARAALHELYASFTTSTLRDRALWLEAEIAKQDGDEAGACDALATLAKDFPDSRYIPCAIGRCPRVARPPKSQAPATCHPYLERE